MQPITAPMLYDLMQCPHRPYMDLFANLARRDKTSPFLKLLWESSTAHELKVIACLEQPILDVSCYTGDEKERKTIEAIQNEEPLIYSGRVTADDLLGEPDLLRREGDGYLAGDIKSGSGEEGDDGTLKKHYGVQLALYTDILERQGLSSSRRPFVWDVHGKEVTYDVDEPQGKRNPWTMWEVYQDALIKMRQIVAQTYQTTPAYCGACKNCHWYTACLSNLETSDDLTLLPELGRAKRDAMVDRIPTVSDLAAAKIEGLISGKKTEFRGIGGADTLRKFHKRAKLIKTEGASPYLTATVSFPSSEIELFFDIEVDSTRDFCYLHGFVERSGGDSATEHYTAFFANAVNPEEEERAFREAWRYITERKPCAVYYYSNYERTAWRKLQIKYPFVCTADDIDNLFHSIDSVDLYSDVVKKATEWPTRDYSLKTLATYLGFNWRDAHPSGANSIEWFDRWIKTRDETIRQRILDYNNDDCVATRVLLDSIQELRTA